jgi:hypothetical protein
MVDVAPVLKDSSVFGVVVAVLGGLVTKSPNKA